MSNNDKQVESINKQSIIKLILGIIISIIVIIYALYNINIQYIIKIKIFYLYVLLFMIIYYLQFIFFSYRWYLIIKSINDIGIKENFFYKIFYTNSLYKISITILPNFLSEGIRTYIIKKETKINIPTAISSVILDRFYDFFAIILFSIISFFFLPYLLKEISQKINLKGLYLFIILSILFFLIILLCIVFRKKLLSILSTKMKYKINFIKNFFKKISLKYFILQLFISIFGVLLMIILQIIVGLSLNMKITFIMAIVIYFFQNFSSLIPSIGNIGPFHASVIFSLSLFEFKFEEALAFAVICHLLISLLQLSFIFVFILNKIKSLFY